MFRAGFRYYPESDDPVYVWIDLLYDFMERVGSLAKPAAVQN